jgi:hypothetical protein
MFKTSCIEVVGEFWKNITFAETGVCAAALAAASDNTPQRVLTSCITRQASL